jgi:hypothetical protein
MENSLVHDANSKRWDRQRRSELSLKKLSLRRSSGQAELWLLFLSSQLLL